MARALPMRRSAVTGARQGGSTRLVRRVVLYGVLTFGAVLSAFPFVWMLLTALKPRQEALANPPTVLPSTWEFHNFVEAWKAVPFGRYFLNSIGVSGVVAAGVVLTSLLAGYAFTRIAFPGRNIIFGIFLATMMIPFESTLIPNFITVTRQNIYNTYAALIIPWLANVVGIFMMRQFFLTLPNELFEAAKMDGCGHFRTLRYVVMPLAKGPMGAVALLNFLTQWNGILWPLLVTGDDSLRPVQLGLSYFVNGETNDPQLQMAAAAFTIAPILVLFFIVQKQFIEGVASSGLK